MAPRTDSSASTFCGGMRPSPREMRRTSSATRANPHPPSPRPDPLEPINLGDPTLASVAVAVHNPCGLLVRRSRAKIPCHSASDLGFPHVDNHVEHCESHV